MTPDAFLLVARSVLSLGSYNIVGKHVMRYNSVADMLMRPSMAGASSFFAANGGAGSFAEVTHAAPTIWKFRRTL